MRTIAVLNQKGGVGKTTIAVNLAFALSNHGKTVLLIDLDPQANSTISITPKKVAKGNIYSYLVGSADLKSSISIINNKFGFIPACMDLAGIEHELTPNSLGIIKEMLSTVDNYDYVIFDCAPSLGLLVLACLTYVKEVFIPVQAEFFALNGLTQLVQTIERVKAKLNPNISITGIIFSMFDGRRLISRDVVKEISSFFSEVIFKTKIRNNVKLVEAQSHGKSIFQYEPDSKGASDFIELAKEVISREQPQPSSIKAAEVIV